VARDGDESHDAHAQDGDDAADVEEQDVMTAGKSSVFIFDEEEVADDEQDAEFRGAEEAVRNVEATDGVCR